MHKQCSALTDGVKMSDEGHFDPDSILHAFQITVKLAHRDMRLLIEMLFSWRDPDGAGYFLEETLMGQVEAAAVGTLQTVFINWRWNLCCASLSQKMKLFWGYVMYGLVLWYQTQLWRHQNSCLFVIDWHCVINKKETVKPFWFCSVSQCGVVEDPNTHKCEVNKLTQWNKKHSRGRYRCRPKFFRGLPLYSEK